MAASEPSTPNQGTYVEEHFERRECNFREILSPADVGDGAAKEENRLTRWRKVVFTNQRGQGRRRLPIHSAEVSVVIKQTYELEQLGGYIWPSALVLGQHFMNLVARRSPSSDSSYFEGKTVVELGAGCGVLSVLLDKLGAHVVSTEAAGNTSLLEQLAHTRTLNGSNFVIQRLTWGDMSSDMVRWLGQLNNVDCIVASDVLYDSSTFEDVLATCSLLLTSYERATIITAYHLRNGNHTLQPLLQKYRLQAKELARSSEEVCAAEFASYTDCCKFVPSRADFQSSDPELHEVALLEITPIK
eukprot:gb/GECG01015413.1/.p1 GENE.gb/GECG01015413.1/~~gb/GECG01015413.1/.p1  ORF type:complete len:301 (+),score=23.63 gb/GECG01015413.1/:1-903(+)